MKNLTDLQKSHEFGSDDLAINRKGTISPGQRKKLVKEFVLFSTTGILSSSFVLLVSVLILRQSHVFGLILIVILIIGLTLLAQMALKLARDLRTNAVGRVSGFVTSVMKVQVKGPPSYTYTCQGIEIRGVPYGGRVEANKLYTLYFSKHSHRFLSIENA